MLSSSQKVQQENTVAQAAAWIGLTRNVPRDARRYAAAGEPSKNTDHGVDIAAGIIKG
jgi:hypothetical protein